MFWVFLVALVCFVVMANAQREDLTRIHVTSNGTTFYGQVPPKCGICIVFNTTSTSITTRQSIMTNKGMIISSNNNCPIYFPNENKVYMFTLGTEVDVFAFSCCMDALCSGHDADLETWGQAIALVVCLMVLILGRKAIFAFVAYLIYGAYMLACSTIINPTKSCYAGVRRRARTVLCSKCGTLKCTNVLCDKCQPLPTFATLQDFIAYFQDAEGGEEAGKTTATPDEDKLCNICFEREREWQLITCKHELCLVCTIKTLRLNGTCPFDRSKIVDVPQRIIDQATATSAAVTEV